MRLGGTVVMKLIYFLGIIYLLVQNASKGLAMVSSFAFEIWKGSAMLGKSYPFCILPKVIKMEKKSFQGKIRIWNDLFKMKNWIKMQILQSWALYSGRHREEGKVLMLYLCYVIPSHRKKYHNLRRLIPTPPLGVWNGYFRILFLFLSWGDKRYGNIRERIGMKDHRRHVERKEEMGTYRHA